MTIKKYICPICKKTYTELESLITHIEKTHEDLNLVLKEKDITIKQYLSNIRNKKVPFNKYGKSIVSGKETEWNEVSGKYNRILLSEKEEYRNMFNKNMIKQHGTNNLLTLPEHQKKMLANRKISGEYLYNNKTRLTYTGKYELDFLEYMDNILHWNVEDLEIPAKEAIIYKDPETKKERFYLPDAYIISLDLLLEIKPSEDFHYKKRDSSVEAAKDEAANNSNHHYLKVYDKDYTDLLLKIKELSENLEE